jgi:hypothetical protein
MIIAAMAFVFFACAIYMALPAYVGEVINWVLVMMILGFGALVSFTIFLNEYHRFTH